MPINWLRVAVGVGLVLAGAIPVHLYYSKEIAQTEAAQSQALAKSAEATLNAHTKETAQLEKDRGDALRKLEIKSKELGDLRAALLNQSVGLRIAARCAGTETNGPGGAGSGTAQLTRDAEQAYLAHRDAIDRTEYLLDLCVATVKLWAK